MLPIDQPSTSGRRRCSAAISALVWPAMRIDAERRRERLRRADPGVVEDHDAVVAGEPVDEAPVPALHRAAVSGDEDERRAVSDRPVGDVALRRVRDPHRNRGDRDVVRDGGRRAVQRLRLGRPDERRHRGGRWRAEVGIGDLAVVPAAPEEHEVGSEADPGQPEAPRVRRRPPANSGQGHVANVDLHLRPPEREGRGAAARQRLVLASPRPSGLRAAREHLADVRDRRPLHERRGHVRQPMRMPRQSPTGTAPSP